MYLFVGASLASLIIMLAVDFLIGPKAEFVNAYSVVERILGRQPSAGDSLVARKLGAFGELGVVLAVNLGVGGLVTAVFRLLTNS